MLGLYPLVWGCGVVGPTGYTDSLKTQTPMLIVPLFDKAFFPPNAKYRFVETIQIFLALGGIEFIMEARTALSQDKFAEVGRLSGNVLFQLSWSREAVHNIQAAVGLLWAKPGVQF